MERQPAASYAVYGAGSGQFLPCIYAYAANCLARSDYAVSNKRWGPETTADNATFVGISNLGALGRGLADGRSDRYRCMHLSPAHHPQQEEAAGPAVA